MGIFDKLFGKNKEKDILVELPVNRIFQNPYQPRRVFKKEEMEQLKQSVKHYGVMTPIMVRKVSNGWELACGERRLRACKELGIKTIPAIVKNLSTPQMVELALIENLVRADMTLLEEADTVERMKKEFAITSDETVAGKLGLTAQEVDKYKRLAKLPMILKKAFVTELITDEHAFLLAKIEGEEKMLENLKEVIEKKLSAAEFKERLNGQASQA